MPQLTIVFGAAGVSMGQIEGVMEEEGHLVSR